MKTSKIAALGLFLIISGLLNASDISSNSSSDINNTQIEKKQNPDYRKASKDAIRELKADYKTTSEKRRLLVNQLKATKDEGERNKIMVQIKDLNDAHKKAIEKAKDKLETLHAAHN